MDVTQIPIKINQTENPKGVKGKTPAQSDAQAGSFNQILLKLNSLNKIDIANGDQGNSQQVPVANENSGNKKLSIEDLNELESILSSFMINMQSTQQMQNQMNNQTAGTDTSNNVVSGTQNQNQQNTAGSINALFPFQQNDTNAANELVSLLQKAGVSTQSLSSIDGNQLDAKLVQIINELSSQGDQNSSDTLTGIGDQIKQMLDELSTTTNPVPSMNIQSEANTAPPLSLDKSQVILSAVPDFSKRSSDGNKLSRLTGSNSSEDKIPSNGILLSGNQTQQNMHVTAESKEPIPQLKASDFADEMNNLVGRYMKITNGQSGSTEAKFNLYPEHLGPIEVKITSQQGQVTAQILTNTSLAKDTLSGQLNHLREALQQQGIVVQKLDIVQQTPAAMDMNQSNLSFSQGGSNSSNGQRNNQMDENSSKKTKTADQNDGENETLPISYGTAVQNAASSIDFSA
ncbi:flagellar hook-length control protein FliK [Bacillus sp. BRMEA1]|uniref:flagellar hook-length control protein FliK n=1 Tax=Neobacillus endophyticus TaxID=2738405 RepID=UPI0015644834|nr:flagellar hook-length control protein FliK [Neobacillus endophyticus]NRD79361.1 flagellar hook-length control protein FliK [Neobacillus endophyticus]